MTLRRLGSPLLLGLVLPLSLCAGSEPAFGYAQTRTQKTNQPMRWAQTCLTLDVHVGDPPAALSGAQVLEGTRGAAVVWTRDALACSALAIDVRSRPTPSGAAQADGINSIMFKRSGWDCPDDAEDEDCYDPKALAITAVYAQVRDGRIVDADIEINAAPDTAGRTKTWADLVAEPGRAAAHDLQNVLTHEIGHLIGLDHTCYTGTGPVPVDQNGRNVPLCGEQSSSRAVRETTMYASADLSDTNKRTLAPDDQAAVCALYPAGGALPCTVPNEVTSGSTEAGGCAMAAPTRSPFPLAVALLGGLGIAVGLRRPRQGPPRRG